MSLLQKMNNYNFIAEAESRVGSGHLVQWLKAMAGQGIQLLPSQDLINLDQPLEELLVFEEREESERKESEANLEMDAIIVGLIVSCPCISPSPLIGVSAQILT